MFEVIDFSSRRGALVPLLPKIHALLTVNAVKDKVAGIAPPENIILWKHRAHREILEIHRRFVLVMDGNSVTGLLFYHFKEDSVYLDQFQIAWEYRHNPAVLDIMTDKFAANREVKACGSVYAGENVKAPADKELLASVGFKETFPDGWEPLGTVAEAVGALRTRYARI